MHVASADHRDRIGVCIGDGSLHVAALLCSGTAIGMMYVHCGVSLPRSTRSLAQARKQVERGGDC